MRLRQREMAEQTRAPISARKGMFLFKNWYLTSNVKRLSVIIWPLIQSGMCAKCTVIENYPPPCPPNTCPAHTITPGMQRRGHADGVAITRNSGAFVLSGEMKQVREAATPEFHLSPPHLEHPLPQQMHIHHPGHDLPTVHSSSSTQHTTMDTTMASSLPPSCTLAMVWRKFPTWTWKERRNIQI